MADDRPGGTVLVVEDDPALRDVLCRTFIEERLAAVGVRDGDEALDYLVFQPPPAVVVLDLRLPGELNGWDILQWMRRDQGLRDVPVVVVSGAPLEHAELTLEHEPRACLQKPVDPEALLSLVREACAGQDSPW